MLTSLRSWSVIAAAGICFSVVEGREGRAQSFPEVEQLPPQADLPDPLILLNGDRVTTARQWQAVRRPELRGLFQHYMYGYLPPAPQPVTAQVERIDRNYFGGKATLKEVTLRFGPPQTPALNLLLVVPNKRPGPAPAFVGLNFCGNHVLLDDPLVRLPTAWMPSHCPGCQDGRATDAGRGTQKETWALEQSIDRGYAVATCYCGDIDPDRNDFSDGVHPHFPTPGETERGPHAWGTIAAWAWGLHRCLDYLVTDADVDPKRIAVVGHSRLGKTALVAGAFDDRFALIIPHQAGCGGTAPNRKTGAAQKAAESVERINTVFPHWFCDAFKQFNKQVERLPFDQHALIALCAPRPVLLTNAEEDQWADPDGQFRMLQGAAPVYRLLGVEGVEATAFPQSGKLVSSRLGYYIRTGKHAMTPADWQVFFDYADKHLPAP